MMHLSKPIHMQGVIKALQRTNKKFNSTLDRQTCIRLIRNVNLLMDKLGYIEARDKTVCPFAKNMQAIYKSFLGSYFGSRKKRKKQKKEYEQLDLKL